MAPEKHPGEFSFYGPQAGGIDIQFKTVTGRKRRSPRCSSILLSLDAFGLQYKGGARTASSTLERPDEGGANGTGRVIHRRPLLDTHERMVRWAESSPLDWSITQRSLPWAWLAPVQVQVITVADRFNDYGQAAWCAGFGGRRVRAEMAAEGETVGGKSARAPRRRSRTCSSLGSGKWRRRRDRSRPFA